MARGAKVTGYCGMPEHLKQGDSTNVIDLQPDAESDTTIQPAEKVKRVRRRRRRRRGRRVTRGVYDTLSDKTDRKKDRELSDRTTEATKLAVRKAGIPDDVTRNSSTDCRGAGCGRGCDHSDVGLIGRRVLSGNTAYPGPGAAISASEENTFTFGGSATAVGGNGLSHLPTATMAKQRCTHDRRVRERETIRPETRGSFEEDFVSGSSCFPLCPRGSPITAWSHWPRTGLSEHHTMSC